MMHMGVNVWRDAPSSTVFRGYLNLQVNYLQVPSCLGGRGGIYIKYGGAALHSGQPASDCDRRSFVTCGVELWSV